jgi:hypothetical protein
MWRTQLKAAAASGRTDGALGGHMCLTVSDPAKYPEQTKAAAASSRAGGA